MRLTYSNTPNAARDHALKERGILPLLRFPLLFILGALLVTASAGTDSRINACEQHTLEAKEAIGSVFDSLAMEDRLPGLSPTLEGVSLQTSTLNCDIRITALAARPGTITTESAMRDFVRLYFLQSNIRYSDAASWFFDSLNHEPDDQLHRIEGGSGMMLRADWGWRYFVLGELMASISPEFLQELVIQWLEFDTEHGDSWHLMYVRNAVWTIVDELVQHDVCSALESYELILSDPRSDNLWSELARLYLSIGGNYDETWGRTCPAMNGLIAVCESQLVAASGATGGYERKRVCACMLSTLGSQGVTALIALASSTAYDNETHLAALDGLNDYCISVRQGELPNLFSGLTVIDESVLYPRNLNIQQDHPDLSEIRFLLNSTPLINSIAERKANIELLNASKNLLPPGYSSWVETIEKLERTLPGG